MTTMELERLLPTGDRPPVAEPRPHAQPASVEADFPHLPSPLHGPPPLLLAGDVDDDGSEPHICRGID
ncbi:hypothetical protein ACFVYF_26545 [Streptomyces sp. NPDC058274]|uniref:hypothetical protein n=1 Tax=Streptomyces sp. NPDC058274 TaxID=3346416 RepID=UPI0036F15C3E